MNLDHLRTTIVAVLFCLVMTGGTSAQSQRRIDDPEAYAIYSLLISNERPIREGRAKKPVIIAETSNHAEISTCLECGPIPDPGIASLVRAFQEVNKSPWQLQRKFTLSLPYELVPEESFRSYFKDADAQGWKEFYKIYPESGGALSMSAVGFDPARTRAL